MKKYERIFASIVEKIETGVFKEGEQVYTEKEIKDLYGVSSTTAVRVLSELENSGYIFRVQGKGSFVSKTLVNKKVSFTESNNFHKYFKDTVVETSRVIGVEIVQDREFCKKIGMPVSQLLKITRVKYIGDVAWAHQTNYISMKYLPNIDIGDIDSFKELATMIRKNYRIDIHKEKSKKKIKVITDIPESVAFYISKENEPCFEFDRFTYMPDGDIFEYVKIYINYKYYEIVIKD
ncbi:GntR family transcriptional regulator [Peptostreptococcus russellii]|uniref:Transcriptional regulator, GntR family n=1 Tax=Peptostreptococcus russellii TaxID=215200 RepID=A0A1H8K9K1_9FIRM|nr:GntR family transcriptional regulator [Peptostreptococcus russellii]MBC2578321.1 GntR family transcriptional regulator [Peptostreptococcus russellii]SEN89381.1 transcriptional regulator, GntR family [Peptostreptococcus russellii]